MRGIKDRKPLCMLLVSNPLSLLCTHEFTSLLVFNVIETTFFAVKKIDRKAQRRPQKCSIRATPFAFFWIAI